MRVLLTGGAGFIGARVAETYLHAGHEVLVVDDLSRGKESRLPQEAEFVQLDVRDRVALSAVLRRFAPQVVNHHAGLVSVRESYRAADRYLRVNIGGTRAVLQAAAEGGVEKFILASSGGTVYGEAQHIPMDEAHPLNPLSPYGESKLSAEQLVRSYRQETGTPALILRYGNVYGPGQDPADRNGVIPIFAAALSRGHRPRVYGDGRQSRDYVYVDDVAQANLLGLEAGVAGTYNIGRGQEVVLVDLLEAIFTQLGVRAEPEFLPPHHFEVFRNALDSRAAAADLGWQATTSLQQGLEKTLQPWSGAAETDASRLGVESAD